MKAITCTQPWASLIAQGAKRIETRTWSIKYRGPLAIHAAKSWGDFGIAGPQRIMEAYPAFGARLGQPLETVPRGVVLATCVLADCIPIEDELVPIEFQVRLQHIPGWDVRDEEDFGGYSFGRYAWLLTDIQPLVVPIPARGNLGLWNWENPNAPAQPLAAEMPVIRQPALFNIGAAP